MHFSDLPQGMAGIGYVLAIDEGTVTLVDHYVYGRAERVAIPHDRAGGTKLEVGDKVVVRSDRDGAKEPEILKVLRHRVPMASTLEGLLSSLRINIDTARTPEMDVNALQERSSALSGIAFNFVKDPDPDIVISIGAKDEGASFCAYPVLDGPNISQASTVRLTIPKASATSVAFLHRLGVPRLDGADLQQTLLCLRILHCILHLIGRSEHMEFEKVVKNWEAADKGDPSIVQAEQECIMSWKGIHLLAMNMGAETVSPSLLSRICSTCLEFPSFDEIHDIVQLMKADKATEFDEYTKLRWPFICYVVGMKERSMLFSVAPLRTNVIYVASEQSQYDPLMEALDSSVIEVPRALVRTSANLNLEVGDKVIAVTNFRTGENDDNYRFSFLEVPERLTSSTRVQDLTGIRHRLGLEQGRLTVRVKWAEGIDPHIVKRSVRKVRKLTHFHFKIDDKPDNRLGQVSKDIGAVESKLSNTKDPQELTALRFEQQRIADSVAPLRSEIEDRFEVQVLVLKSSSLKPTTAFGDLAAGETSSGLYVKIAMPPYGGKVILISEACRNCSKNFANGKDVSQESIFSTYLLHELLHLVAGLQDHRGECKLCAYDKPEMLPLRFTECDECTKNEGNYAHQNCVMSYACVACIASRLNEASSTLDMLCDQCTRSVRSEAAYLMHYFRRVNGIIYQNRISKAWRSQFEKFQATEEVTGNPSTP